MTQITQRAIEGRAIYHQLARIHAESEKVRAGQLSGGAFHTRTARMIDDLVRIAEHHSQQLNAALLAQSTVIHRCEAPGRAGIATVSTGLRDIINQDRLTAPLEWPQTDKPEDFCAEEGGTMPQILTDQEEPCPTAAPTEPRTPTAPEAALDVPASC